MKHVVLLFLFFVQAAGSYDEKEPRFGSRTIATLRETAVYCHALYQAITDENIRDGQILHFLNSPLHDSLGEPPAKQDVSRTGQTGISPVEVYRLAEIPRVRHFFPFDPNIDLQRLISPADWRKELQSNREPSDAYGENTKRDWIAAETFVRRDGNGEPLSLNLLRQIHGLANRSTYYFSFESRRIWTAYQDQQISFENARAAIRRNETTLSFLQIDHASLGDRLREDPIDAFWETGDHYDENGSGYFTKIEIEAYRANPFFQIAHGSLHDIGNNNFRAKFLYLTPKEVRASTERVLKTAALDLNAATNDETYILAVLKMERSLISIHPFLDGNGRSIRLLSDLLYLRRGLPPPLFPKEGDFTKPLLLLYEEPVTGMNAYTQAHRVGQILFSLPAWAKPRR